MRSSISGGGDTICRALVGIGASALCSAFEADSSCAHAESSSVMHSALAPAANATRRVDRSSSTDLGWLCSTVVLGLRPGRLPTVGAGWSFGLFWYVDGSATGEGNGCNVVLGLSGETKRAPGDIDSEPDRLVDLADVVLTVG